MAVSSFRPPLLTLSRCRCRGLLYARGVRIDACSHPQRFPLQMRKLNPDERYRRSRRRTTSRPLSNWTDSTDRERETERPLFLFTRSARQLVSFHGRFIKGAATKSSATARKGGRREPNISSKHRDLASKIPASGWNRRRVSVISNIARRQERGSKRDFCNFDCHVAHLVHV